MERWNVGILGKYKSDAENRRLGDPWLDRLTMIGLTRSP
jgi:hypothetical protein